jgi:O-antigen/teichoic acid export membrane protein
LGNGSNLRRNIIANFSGKFIAAIAGIAFVPFYIRFLGIESYGLIGVYLSLAGLLSLLDMGLSATLSRELARLAVLPESDQESKDLLRTLEYIYSAVGLLAGVAVAMLAPLVARHWIRPQAIPPDIVEQAIKIMGMVIAFQWPASLYAGGLIGIQRQVPLNVIRSVMSLVQSGGAVLILWLISPTITGFFLWQALTGVVHTVLLAWALWARMPRGDARPAFRKELLIRRWHFAAGITGISLMVTILTQADKILLSKILSLEVFGYYMLAYSISSTISQFTNPLFSALYPKLSELAASSARAALSELYHKGCQLVSILIVPATLILIFFPREILMLWIGDAPTVDNTHRVLSLLMIGTALNAAMTVPFALQLACGWTKLSFYKNLIAVILLIPLLIWLASVYGAMGAAIVWIVLNLGYFLFEIPIMHSRFLKGEMWRWYIRDIGEPLLGALPVMVFSRLLFPGALSGPSAFLWLAVTGTLSILCAGMSPAIKHYKDLKGNTA